MKTKGLMRFQVGAKITTKILCAKTGKVLKQQEKHNVVLTRGVNGLARDNSNSLSCEPASIFTYCKIGDGTAPNYTNNPSDLFTVVGTTCTCTGTPFTAGMVGYIVSTVASGNTVMYLITGFTNSSTVTVSPLNGAGDIAGEDCNLWNMTQTALGNQLYQSNTYQTNGGDNYGPVENGGAEFQRTFIFGTQASTYNVNEIGYSPISGSSICGRAVLSATDVVSPVNIYVVVIQFLVAYVPVNPAAVPDVGTAIDTAGLAMVEGYQLRTISSSGNMSNTNNGLDSRAAIRLRINSTYTQDSAPSIPPAGLQWSSPNFISIVSATNWAYVAASFGLMRLSSSYATTSTGQTCYGVGFGFQLANAGTDLVAFDVKFTTPATLPNGALAGSISFEIQYYPYLET